MPSTSERPGSDTLGVATASTASLIGIVPIVLLIAYVVYSRYITTPSPSPYSKLPLPPGPPRLPLVGNMLNYSQHTPWLTHYQWRYAYGPVVYVEVFGQPVVILTTVQGAHDLLNKKAAKYPGRPYSATVGILSRGYNMILRQYDSRQRLHQRLIIRGLGTRAVQLYHPVQSLESVQLIHDIIQGSRKSPVSNSYLGQGTTEKSGAQPIDPSHDLLRLATSAFNVIAYGARLLKGDAVADAKFDYLHTAPSMNLYKTIHWIDIFPSLRHIPYFFSPWKRKVEPLFRFEQAHNVDSLRKALQRPGYNLAKQVAGSAERLSADMSETEVAFLAGTLMFANIETSPALMSWFVVTMMAYPDVMHKAQGMLDEVVGRERLPEFSDRERLPYIGAILDELFRWRMSFPSGVNHSSVEEDEYMGYRIPKGATVVASQWALGRDREAYGADCENFRPERWLEGRELPVLVFGFGRRICPGRHLARDGMWIAMARMLWAFEMEPPIDPATGKKKIVDTMASPSTGLVIQPDPYETVFKPRGEWVEEIVAKGINGTGADVNQIVMDLDAAKI